jgi:hypothetical protein
MILETISAGQLVAHLIGDYCLQSDWMANSKTKRWLPAIAHALTYTLVFLLFTISWQALLFIFATHLIIDRYRLARYVCWAKNFLAPKWSPRAGSPIERQRMCVDRSLLGEVIEFPPSQAFVITEVNEKTYKALPVERWWFRWFECSTTGYNPHRDAWMTAWLLIIADSTLHLICNGIALHVWP